MRQRHLVPPRNIPRFKKYFPKKVCECSYPENPLKRKKTKKIGQKKGKYPSTNHRNVIPGTETVTAFTYRLPHHLKVAQFNERQHLKRGQEIEKTNFVKQGGNQNPYLTQALLRKQQDEQESLANNQINEALEEQKEAILDQVSSVEDEEESDDEEQSEEEDDYEAGGESNVSEVFVTNPNIVMAEGQQGFNGIPDDVTLPSFNAQFDERDLYQATGGNFGPDEVVLNEPVIDSHNGRPNKDRATTLTQTFRADESSASDFILPTFDIRGGTMDDMMTAPSHWSRCPDTPNYATDDGKQYLLTSLEPGCPKMTWGDALDFCQKHAGMQAVAFQKGKNSNRIAAILGLVGKIDTKLGSFWTSGYIRHARKQGDQTTINWNTVDRRNEVVARGSKYWDKDGPMGEPQPDNYAFRMGLSKDREKCAVAHRNARTQAAALHDELCDRKFHVVCEAAYMDIMGLGAFSTASGDMM